MLPQLQNKKKKKKAEAAAVTAGATRAELRAAAADLRAEKQRLQVLAGEDYYPELAMMFPGADLLGVADLGGLVRPGISFEAYVAAFITLLRSRSTTASCLPEGSALLWGRRAAAG